MPGAFWGEGKSSWQETLVQWLAQQSSSSKAMSTQAVTDHEHRRRNLLMAEQVFMTLEDQRSKNLREDLQEQKLWALDQANTWVDLDPREFQVPYKVMLTWYISKTNGLVDKELDQEKEVELSRQVGSYFEATKRTMQICAFEGCDQVHAGPHCIWNHMALCKFKHPIPKRVQEKAKEEELRAPGSLHGKLRALTSLDWGWLTRSYICKKDKTCGLGIDEPGSSSKLDKPCRWFMQGKCFLATCKFRHLTPEEMEYAEPCVPKGKDLYYYYLLFLFLPLFLLLLLLLLLILLALLSEGRSATLDSKPDSDCRSKEDMAEGPEEKETEGKETENSKRVQARIASRGAHREPFS